MNGHPGGDGQTRAMLALASLPAGASVLDMGAGGGGAVRLLREQGYDACGIDLLPRGDGVSQGSFLDAPYADGSFDAVLSQCSFFVSGSQSGALREAHRLLKPDGRLLLSDVFFEDPAPLLAAAGFELLRADDRTAEWRAYYLEALWREDPPCCPVPRGKCRYWLIIARRV